MYVIRLFPLIFAVLLVACATPTPPPAIEVPGEDPNKTVLPPPTTSAAVVNLLNQAREATRVGDLQRAEVLLERTVRIEPRNAALWHYLAKLRLHQARLQDAMGLAAKSNSLAGNDSKLKADNWRIIAHARQQTGDTRGAREAQDRANALSDAR